MIAPTATIDQLTTNPTSRTTAPIASPTGHRLGPGTCGWSWLGSTSSDVNVQSDRDGRRSS